jgi:hypothetical protein
MRSVGTDHTEVSKASRHGVSVVGRLNVDSRSRMPSTLNTGSPRVPWSTMRKVHLDSSLDLVQVEAFAFFFSHLPILFSRFSSSPSCSSTSSPLGCPRRRVWSRRCGHFILWFALCIAPAYLSSDIDKHAYMRVNASPQKHSRWIALFDQRCACDSKHARTSSAQGSRTNCQLRACMPCAAVHVRLAIAVGCLLCLSC